jgi:splicing suppressor protein 51
VAFHIYFIGPDVLFTHKEQGAAMHVKETTKYGVPAFTTYISEQLSLTSIKAPYDKVHDSFGGFDPYK